MRLILEDLWSSQRYLVKRYKMTKIELNLEEIEKVLIKYIKKTYSINSLELKHSNWKYYNSPSGFVIDTE